MQASFYIIVRNGFSMNFSIRGSSAWWSRGRMVRVTALDIQVSLRIPTTAMLKDSMTSVKTLCTILLKLQYNILCRSPTVDLNYNSAHIFHSQ